MRCVFAEKGQEIEYLELVFAEEGRKDLVAKAKEIARKAREIPGVRVLVEVDGVAVLWKRELGGTVLMVERSVLEAVEPGFLGKTDRLAFLPTVPLDRCVPRKVVRRLSALTRRYLRGTVLRYLAPSYVLPVLRRFDRQKCVAEMVSASGWWGGVALATERVFSTHASVTDFGRLVDSEDPNKKLLELIEEHVGNNWRGMILAEDRREALEFVRRIFGRVRPNNKRELQKLFKAPRGNATIAFEKEQRTVLLVTLCWRKVKGKILVYAVVNYCDHGEKGRGTLLVKVEKGVAEHLALGQDVLKRYLRAKGFQVDGEILDFKKGGVLYEVDGVRVLATKNARVELPEQYPLFYSIDNVVWAIFRKREHEYTEEDVEAAIAHIVAHKLAGVWV